MISLILWLVVGALAGFIASLITGDDKRLGAFGNIVVGIIGSVIGGTVVNLLSTGSISLTDGYTGVNLASIATAVLGAVILLAAIKAFKRPATL